MKFEILHQKTIYTNEIKPRNIPEIANCKGRIVFKNTTPKAGEVVLFAGCDFRNREIHKHVGKRKGVIIYKGKRYQYAVIEK